MFKTRDFEKNVKRINEMIYDVLDGEPERLYESARYIINAGGKRIRPILLVVSARAVGGAIDKEVLSSAAAIELVHTFTLIHDDIMDEDELRRGMKTVHTVYGNATAILAGDLLLSKAFELCDPKVKDILAKTNTEICEGQQMDISFEERGDVSMKEYMKMIKKKTGVLIEASSKMGAILGGGNRAEVDALSVYGLNIGVAFQIHDDILDLVQNEKILGKPRGSDIIEGKKTMIIIKALEVLKGSKRKELLSILDNPHTNRGDIKRATDILIDCGAIDYAKTKARDLITEAKKSIGILPESESKKILINFADFVVERDK